MHACTCTDDLVKNKSCKYRYRRDSQRNCVVNVGLTVKRGIVEGKRVGMTTETTKTSARTVTRKTWTPG